MILNYVKKMAEKQEGGKISDCVITVNPMWGPKERFALLSASKIAKLNVLAYMGENSAAALYYGLERQDDKTHRVIFYNLGHSGLKVTLAEFSRVEHPEKKKKVEEVRILADAFTDKVSGMKFDHILT